MTDYLYLSRYLASAANLPCKVLAATLTHVTLQLDSDPASPQVWTAEDFVAWVDGELTLSH